MTELSINCRGCQDKADACTPGNSSPGDEQRASERRSVK